MHSES